MDIRSLFKKGEGQEETPPLSPTQLPSVFDQPSQQQNARISQQRALERQAILKVVNAGDHYLIQIVGYQESVNTASVRLLRQLVSDISDVPPSRVIDYAKVKKVKFAYQQPDGQWATLAEIVLDRIQRSVILMTPTGQRCLNLLEMLPDDTASRIAQFVRYVNQIKGERQVRLIPFVEYEPNYEISNQGAQQWQRRKKI